MPQVDEAMFPSAVAFATHADVGFLFRPRRCKKNKLDAKLLADSRIVGIAIVGAISDDALRVHMRRQHGGRT